MNKYAQLKEQLQERPKRWLITGVAGFIGSNLLETLLKLDQQVVGLDNFATGYQHNLEQIRDRVSAAQWQRFRFIEGDIRDINSCRQAMSGVDYVLHQAALGSVPRSIKDPITTNEVNITGFLNMLVAARDEQVDGFVYAASSSTYGDHPGLPKVEETIGNPLSPYAVTKYVNELYCSVFEKTYGFKGIGLRYFNVFGPRQDPDGAYAAVIPKWTAAIIKQQTLQINGDGETSRDFCFIENVVQMNLLAALATEDAKGEVYNVACNARTSLNQLQGMLYDALSKLDPALPSPTVVYQDFRPGDVRHSQADISKACTRLGYEPAFEIREGIARAMPWYVDNL